MYSLPIDTNPMGKTAMSANHETHRARIHSASDATKTTLTDLLATSTNQVNPLLANSVDETIEFDEAPTLTPPRVGEYWQGQGGFYAGIIRDGDRQWHLLLAAELIEVSSLDSAEPEFIRNASQPAIAGWGDYGTELEGDFSARDGMHNTYLILASDSENEIASHCTALLIDGRKDFYWPAKHELSLLCATLPEHFSNACYWSSTQYSAHYAWYQHFEDGDQHLSIKVNSLAARAVRRISIQ